MKYLLSIDPGKTHFAYSIFTLNGDIVKTGMIHSTINSFSIDTFSDMQDTFIKEVKDACKGYKIKEIVAERYQVRGGKFASMMGANAEYISFMLGVLSAVYRKSATTTLISPALWKKYIYDNYNVPKKSEMTVFFGFKGLSKTSTTVPIKEHQFDSASIGIWWFNYFKRKDVFKNTRKFFIKEWKKNKPTSKVGLKAYNKVSILNIK